MNLFNLPKSTIVDRIIPKNAFDNHINPKQKKILSEHIEKIRWVNKISKETINISGKELHEIQLFEIALKTDKNTEEILEIINKAIPYAIIFIILYQGSVKVSTAKKHLHPNNEEKSIIEWTFTSQWVSLDNFSYHLNLKDSIDSIYVDFCTQISSPITENTDIETLIQNEDNKRKLMRQIQKLENKINHEPQFNIKLALNLQLQQLKEVLIKL